MRLLFVTPRYGSMARGEASERCRALAERLAARGHETEVLTTRAEGPLTVEPVLPPGTSEEGGVRVHRTLGSGPKAPELSRQLLAPRADAVVFVSHGAWTTIHGLEAMRRPALLLPGEPLPRGSRLGFCGRAFERAATVLLDVPEEEALLRRACPRSHPHVVGRGAEVEVETPAPSEALRGLGPYVLLAGPLEAADGYAVAVEQFLRVGREGRSRLSLALLGRGRIDLRENVQVRKLGELPAGEVRAAMAGARAVLVPSRREALHEDVLLAWSAARPVLVGAQGEVMRGVVERTGGGLAYRGSEELGAALRLLEEDPGVADTLGRQGARALRDEHAWPGVLARCERAFERVAGAGKDAA